MARNRAQDDIFYSAKTPMDWSRSVVTRPGCSHMPGVCGAVKPLDQVCSSSWARRPVDTTSRISSMSSPKSSTIQARLGTSSCEPACRPRSYLRSIPQSCSGGVWSERRRTVGFLAGSDPSSSKLASGFRTIASSPNARPRPHLWPPGTPNWTKDDPRDAMSGSASFQGSFHWAYSSSSAWRSATAWVPAWGLGWPSSQDWYCSSSSSAV